MAVPPVRVLPLALEVDELLERLTWLRVAALLLNLFAVAYILWAKRLFGVRGGRVMSYLRDRAVRTGPGRCPPP